MWLPYSVATLHATDEQLVLNGTPPVKQYDMQGIGNLNKSLQLLFRASDSAGRVSGDP